MVYICHFNRIKSYPIHWPLIAMGLNRIALHLHRHVCMCERWQCHVVCGRNGGGGVRVRVCVSDRPMLFRQCLPNEFHQIVRITLWMSLLWLANVEVNVIICLHSHTSNESKCAIFVYTHTSQPARNQFVFDFTLHLRPGSDQRPYANYQRWIPCIDFVCRIVASIQMAKFNGFLSGIDFQSEYMQTRINSAVDVCVVAWQWNIQFQFCFTSK